VKETPASSAVGDGKELSSSSDPSGPPAPPPDGSTTTSLAAIAAAAEASPGVHGFSTFKRTVVDLKSRWKTLVMRYKCGWEMPEHLRFFVEDGAFERAVDAFEKNERLQGQLRSRIRRDLDLDADHDAEGRGTDASEDRDELAEHTRPPAKVQVREQTPVEEGAEEKPDAL